DEELLTLDRGGLGRVAVHTVLPARASRVVRRRHRLAPATQQALPTLRLVAPLVVATATDTGRLDAGGVAHADTVGRPESGRKGAPGTRWYVRTHKGAGHATFPLPNA